MNVHDTISIYHDEALVKLFIRGESQTKLAVKEIVKWPSTFQMDHFRLCAKRVT